MRLRWDSVTASLGKPCLPRGSRSFNLLERLLEVTRQTVEEGSRPLGSFFPKMSLWEKEGGWWGASYCSFCWPASLAVAAIPARKLKPMQGRKLPIQLSTEPAGGS